MAWEDVPAKLDEYEAAEYAPPDARGALIRAYSNGQSEDIADIPEHRRVEFEEQLDYRLGACLNLAASRAWTPDMLRKAQG